MQQIGLSLDFAESEFHRAQRKFHYRMPDPQYLGAKHKLLPWICDFIPEGTNTVLDGFSGSQSVAFEMKKHGYAVYTNDFLSFCHAAGVALVENKQAILTESDLAVLFSENEKRTTTMMRFKDIFFIEAECVFLDNFRANIKFLNCPYKRNLAIAVMCRSLTRKTIMGHFAHLRAIPYARDPARNQTQP